jgi:hypothetical protein
MLPLWKLASNKWDWPPHRLNVLATASGLMAAVAGHGFTPFWWTCTGFQCLSLGLSYLYARRIL